ncbi:MAG: ChuX/HutX family heme-like substrate-binding protein [Pseudomonadota bacterium]|nr:ChuX/HutX family heme-like substrate-binding protein [Pseudomonadota bacterium]
MSNAIEKEAARADQASARAAFSAERAQGRRALEAARAIGLSEGAAVAAHVGAPAGGAQARALRPDWLALLQALQACGPLMALTRNEHAVHEKTGIYQNVSGNTRMGLALGPDIDLRLFLTHWHAGFAFADHPAPPSLQFFDATGRAVHKVFVREATDLAAWRAVIDAFALPADAPATVFSAPAPPPAARPDADIDQGGLLGEWAQLEDTHDFFGLLKAYGVQREQALRLAEGRFTRTLATTAVRALLLAAALDGTPIMCFVGSSGCTQIHTGPVHRIEPMDMRGARWLNVLDPGFNLHLREDAIARVWVVEKPTTDGVVTAVEVFDAQGEVIAMFFGERKPGVPELPAWRALVADLPPLTEPVAA